MFVRKPSSRIVITSFVAIFALFANLVVGSGRFAAQAGSAAPEKAAAKTAPEPQQAQPRLEQAVANTGVYFEENRGQQNSRVKYMTRGGAHTVFLTATEAVYVLMGPPTAVEQRPDARPGDPREREREMASRMPRTATALYMTLEGARTDANFVPSDQLEHRTNYFRGSDPNGWHTDIPNYRQITANNIYDGIDAVWHGRQDGSMEYDFVVAPGADPSQIEWRIDGANNVSIDGDSNLVIDTDNGRLVQQRPFTYQGSGEDRTQIASSFVVGDRRSQIANRNSFTVRFDLGGFNRTQPLVIDPSVPLNNLAFSTYLGGNQHDEGQAITVDRAGNVYVTGTTSSSTFPTTPGSFNPSSINGQAFVTKINPAGSSLLYSTIFGGVSGVETPYGIAVDTSGNAFLTGKTNSPNFPTTSGAFDQVHNVNPSFNDDAFLMKLNAAGSALIYSSYLGGDGNDEGHGIAINASGNAYVTGFTSATGEPATDFPFTAGAYDTTHNGGKDAFVTEFNTAGSALVFSTFLGGSADDEGNGLGLASSRPVVTGYTVGTGAPETDFPTVSGNYDTTHNGGKDVFLTTLEINGNALAASTFLGGDGDDDGRAVAIGGSRAYVTGNTVDSTIDYPTTGGSYDTTPNGGTDVFVTRIFAFGTSFLDYSTFIGGGFDDYIGGLSAGNTSGPPYRGNGNAIFADAAGNAYIAGSTRSSDFPTFGAFDTNLSGFEDAFVTKFNTNSSGLSSLSYSTYMGGSITGGTSNHTEGLAIASDVSGNVFVTGETRTLDFPITPGAFQNVFGTEGFDDGFISKFGNYSMSGRTLDTSGVSIPNAAIGLSGDGDGFMLTDATGAFGFSNQLQNGTFLISASSVSYTFNPANYNIANFNRNKTVTFVGLTTGAFAGRADLGGRVTSTAGNIGLANTRLTLVDPVDAANTRAVMTDTNGNYRFNDVEKNRYYHVFASRDGYGFDPGDLGLAFLSENLNLTFTARPTNPRPVKDLDGDGKTDLVVFRPSDGNWYIRGSQTGVMRSEHFGVAGDIPAAADFDGDRVTDIAVFRPSDGNWYWMDSSTGAFHAVQFGLEGDRPVPGDYDGDHKADLAVYRPSDGNWYRVDSSTGTFNATHWGISTDVPVPADSDGDGRTDIAVFRDGTWYRLGSATGIAIYQYGSAGDIPMAADLTGDGWPDSAVFRPSDGNWYWLDNRRNESHGIHFGQSGDVPVVADYDGDGRLEPAVYRGGTWYIAHPDGSTVVEQFGLPNDLPIPAAN